MYLKDKALSVYSFCSCKSVYVLYGVLTPCLRNCQQFELLFLLDKFDEAGAVQPFLRQLNLWTFVFLLAG